MINWIFFEFLLIFGIVLGQQTDNCTKILDVFADATSKFTSCALYHSRPIKMCENCINAYINLLDSYQNLSKFSDNETACINYYVNLDRLEIVDTLFNDNYNLWNRAKCSECFHFMNGSITPQPSEKTITFNNKYNQLMTCLNRSDINDKTLCPACIDDYTNLHDYYLSISNVNEKIGVCMDILDLMNNTWTFWSVKCCKYRRHNEYIFIGSTILMSLLTVLFYIITKFSSEKRTPTILQQSRFMESLSAINYSIDE